MANTGNAETDQLHDLVDITLVKKRLLGVPLAAKDGFSLEVFNNGEHLASVALFDPSVTSDQAKLRPNMSVSGDSTIVSVHLAPYTLTWDGTLNTQDGYRQTYHAELIIHVLYPEYFAQLCLRHSDPVKMIRLAIGDALQSYARRTNHDDIHLDKLIYIAENTLLLTRSKVVGDNRATGLNVRTATITHFYDPHRAQVIEAAMRVREKEEQLAIEKQLTEHHKQELQLEEARRLAELQTEASIKIKAAEEAAKAEKVSVQEKDAIQRIIDQNAQERQRKNLAFDFEKDANRKDHEREEAARQKEYEREELLKEEEYEYDAQQRDLHRKRALLLDQNLLEDMKRERQWSVEEETRKRQWSLEDETRRRVHIQMEQDQLRQSDLDEQRLLGQGRLDKLQRVQLGEKSAFERHQDGLANDHRRKEELKQMALEMKNNVDKLTLEQKTGFFNTLLGTISEQVNYEIQQGATLSDIYEVMKVIDEFSPYHEQPSSQQKVEITQHNNTTTEVASSEQDQTARPEPESSKYVVYQTKTLSIPAIGLSLIQTQLSPEQCVRVEQGLDADTVFIIWHIDMNSPAKRIHIEVGDMLVDINGTRIRSKEVLAETLQIYANEATVTLGLLRGTRLVNWPIEPVW